MLPLTFVGCLTLLLLDLRVLCSLSLMPRLLKRYQREIVLVYGKETC